MLDVVRKTLLTFAPKLKISKICLRRYKKHRLMKQRIIIFILLVCNVFTNAFAQDICGKIQDEQHSPISYATVFLCNSSDSSFIAGCTTDQSGFFCFQDLKELKQCFFKNFMPWV